MNCAENLALMPSLISKEPTPFNSIGQAYNPKGGSELCDEKLFQSVLWGFGGYILLLHQSSSTTIAPLLESSSIIGLSSLVAARTFPRFPLWI